MFTNPDSVGGDTLALVVGALLAVATTVAATLGLDVQWRSAVEILVPILGILTGTGLNLTQSGKNYQSAKVQNTPITGYSRVTGNDTPPTVGG